MNMVCELLTLFEGIVTSGLVGLAKTMFSEIYGTSTHDGWNARYLRAARSKVGTILQENLSLSKRCLAHVECILAR